MCCPSVEAAGTRRVRVAGRCVLSSELLRFGRGANSFSSAMWGLFCVLYLSEVLRTASRLSTGLSSISKSNSRSLRLLLLAQELSGAMDFIYLRQR